LNDIDTGYKWTSPEVRLGEVGTYSTGVLLLDRHNSAKLPCRSTDTIFEPTADLERHGFVPDVVFPTGVVETYGSYLVHFGAADTRTAVVEYSKDEVLGSLV
jgi:beta-1,2-mannobiose phosphorylase / 1,2-beta-oligomannan phosphorylase